MKAPTPEDITRLEKAAWDAHVDQVLVWERDRHTALRAQLAALVQAMRTNCAGARSDWKSPVFWADRLAALLQEMP